MIRILAFVAFLFGLGVALPCLAAPTITINGGASATVAPGAQFTVAVAGGPGNSGDYIDFRGGGIEVWAYLNGTYNAPKVGLTAASVTLLAPTTLGSYIGYFMPPTGSTPLAGPVTLVVSTAPTPPPTGSGVSSIQCTGTVSCPKSTGDVSITGSSVPGPPGPPGSMARCTPPVGAQCVDGDSCFDYDNPTAPTKRTIYTCGPEKRWRPDVPVPVGPPR